MVLQLSLGNPKFLSLCSRTGKHSVLGDARIGLRKGIDNGKRLLTGGKTSDYLESWRTLI